MLLITGYVDGLPLPRFEKVLGRHGVDIPPQTLARRVFYNDDRKSGRHEQSLAAAAQLNSRIKKRLQVTVQNALDKTISFLARNWCKLACYVEVGYSPIDNNAAERAIRSFVIERKN